jgi:transcriptional regulator with XRE-family HTH domain
MATTAYRIRMKRKEAKLTQRQLGDKVGAESMSVSRWERGASEPSDENITRLAEVFGVSRAWLKYGVEDGDIAKVTLHAWTTERIPEVQSAAEQVIADLGLPDDIADRLRTTVWNTGNPSYSTLRSFAVDLLGQQSGKLRKAPPTKVDLPEDAMRREPKRAPNK